MSNLARTLEDRHSNTLNPFPYTDHLFQQDSQVLIVHGSSLKEILNFRYMIQRFEQDLLIAIYVNHTSKNKI